MKEEQPEEQKKTTSTTQGEEKSLWQRLQEMPYSPPREGARVMSWRPPANAVKTTKTENPKP